MDKNKTEQQSENIAEMASAEPNDQSMKQASPWYKRKLYMGLAALLLIAAGGAGAIQLTGNSDSDDYSEPVTTTEQQKPLNLSAAIALSEGGVEYSSDSENWQAVEGGETITVGA